MRLHPHLCGPQACVLMVPAARCVHNIQYFYEVNGLFFPPDVGPEGSEQQYKVCSQRLRKTGGGGQEDLRIPLDHCSRSDRDVQRVRARALVGGTLTVALMDPSPFYHTGAAAGRISTSDGHGPQVVLQSGTRSEPDLFECGCFGC